MDWLETLTSYRKACIAFVGYQNLVIGYGTAAVLGMLLLDLTILQLLPFIWLVGAVMAVTARFVFG